MTIGIFIFTAALLSYFANFVLHRAAIKFSEEAFRSGKRSAKPLLCVTSRQKNFFQLSVSELPTKMQILRRVQTQNANTFALILISYNKLEKIVKEKTINTNQKRAPCALNNPVVIFITVQMPLLL